MKIPEPEPYLITSCSKLRIKIEYLVALCLLRKRIFANTFLKEICLPFNANHLHKIKRICRIIYFFISELKR